MQPWKQFAWTIGCLAALYCAAAMQAHAQDDPPAAAGFDPPEGLAALAPDADVWIDMKRKLVVADGRIAMREGALEMFACPAGTKEHESIVAIKGKAQLIHAALLAVGAKTGQPVQFEPEYQPATGTPVEVLVLYRDAEGKQHQVPAQSWVRNVQTGKQLEQDWVFAGSGFWKDPADGRQYYMADAGDLICVSNFPTATLDLPVPSSQANDSLLFEAFTERIPPRGTPVRLVLRPRQKQQDQPAKQQDEAAKQPDQPAEPSDESAAQ